MKTIIDSFHSTGGRQIGIGEILRYLFIVAFPVAAVVFGRDVFAVQSPLGRIAPFDLVAIAFIGICVLFFVDEIRLTRVSAVLVSSLLVLGLSGVLTSLFLSTWSVLPQPGRALADSFRYALFGATLLFFSQILRRERHRKAFIVAWVGTLVTVVLVGLAQGLAVAGVSPFDPLFYWENIRYERIASTLRWQGPMTAFLGISLPFAAGLIISINNWMAKFGLGLVLIGGLLVLVLSGGRSGVLMMPLALLPLLLALRSWRAIVAGLIGSIATVAVVSVAAGEMASRIVSEWAMTLANPLEIDRAVRWVDAIEVWLANHPVAGLGPRQLPWWLDHYSHSSIVGIPVERGLLGVIALSAFVLCVAIIAFHFIRDMDSTRFALHFAVAMALGNMVLYFVSAEGLTYRMNIVLLAYAVAAYDATRSDPISLQRPAWLSIRN